MSLMVEVTKLIADMYPEASTLGVNLRPVADSSKGDLTTDFFMRLAADRKSSLKDIIADFKRRFQSSIAVATFELDYLILKLNSDLYWQHVPTKFFIRPEDKVLSGCSIAIILKLPTFRCNSWAHMRLMAAATLQYFCLGFWRQSSLFFADKKIDHRLTLPQLYRTLVKISADLAFRDEQDAKQQVKEVMSNLPKSEGYLWSDTVLFDQRSFDDFTGGSLCNPHMLAPTPDWLYPIEADLRPVDLDSFNDAQVIDLVLHLAGPDTADALDIDDLVNVGKYSILAYAQSRLKRLQEIYVFSGETSQGGDRANLSPLFLKIARNLCFFDKFILQAGAHARVADFVLGLRELIYRTDSLLATSDFRMRCAENRLSVSEHAILSSLIECLSAIIANIEV